MKQWKKIAVIAAPLLVVGSVYAFASSSSNVSFSVHPIQGSANQASPSSTAGNALTSTAGTSNGQSTVASNDLTTPPANIQNPFLVQDSNNMTSLNSNDQPQVSTNGDINWESIRHLLLHATSQSGPIDLNYVVAGNGDAKLEGHAEGKSIHLTGEEAKQLCQSIVNQFQFLGTLQKVANGGSAQITLPSGVQIQNLQVQLDTNQTFHISNKPSDNPGKEAQNPKPKKPEQLRGHGKAHQKGNQSDDGNEAQGDQEDGD